MAKSKEKNIALALRTKGLSITDIATRLKVSKSTVSGWCRDIVLTPKAISKIAKLSNVKSTAGLLRYSELIRKRRQENTQLSHDNGEKQIGKLSDRDIYCIGIGLYWGEGYKTGSQEFGFTNSDPRMVLFYVRWLETIFAINKSDLILRVSINELHKLRIREVEQFWAKLVDVSLVQFTKISLIKTAQKKIYTNTNHMGTLRIKVRKGTSKRREVLGAIAGIVKQI